MDTKSHVFHNLNGALNEISLVSYNNGLVLYNNRTQSLPVFVHGNGPTKMYMNRLGNYIGKAYSVKDGCKLCSEEKITLDEDVKII